MHPYPHRYTVSASGSPVGNVRVTATGLPDIQTAPPAEFDGPGDVWSPESLLCASIADCFILTFRAIARASKFEWSDLSCRVEAVWNASAAHRSLLGIPRTPRSGLQPGAKRHALILYSRRPSRDAWSPIR